MNRLRALVENTQSLAVVKLTRDLRAAIDANDRAAEAKIGKALKAEMAKVAKPALAAYKKDLKAFMQHEQQKLAHEFGLEIELFSEGEPVIQHGWSQSLYAVKIETSQVLIVDTPEVK